MPLILRFGDVYTWLIALSSLIPPVIDRQRPLLPALYF